MLVIVLPIIYVGIPKKAQREINASSLEVTSQEVTNPTADGVHLKIQNVIRSGSSFHPTIDSFRAGLSLKDQKPFLYVDVPKAKSEAETHVTVEQDVKFASMDAFTTYTKTVLGSETFQVHLDGKTKLHLSILPAMDVNYNKVVTMKGKFSMRLWISRDSWFSRVKQTLWSQHQRRKNPFRRKRNPL